MTVGIVIVPELEKQLVQRRGIVTVPREDALAACWCGARQRCRGLSLNDLPLEMRKLEIHLKLMADKFRDRMAIRGYELIGDLRLHGPWVSYEFNQTLADVESTLWREAAKQDDPSIALPFIIERNAASPYSDYLLVGDFLAKATMTEIILKEE